METENIPNEKERVVGTIVLIVILMVISFGIYLVVNHFSKENNHKEVVDDIKTIDLESDEGNDLVERIESKYGQKIYFLQEKRVVDFKDLKKVEKVCLGLKEVDTTVTIDNTDYNGYTENQILENLKVMFGTDIKIDPLEKMGSTLMYQEICPSDFLNYSAESAAYYVKPFELTEPQPDVISKINRIEKQDNNLIVYASAIFRDSKGIVYKDLKEQVKIAEFALTNDGKTFENLSTDKHPFDYYLQNSYQYTFTFTADNLYWISYERSEQ